jgi:hypothetical protein
VCWQPASRWIMLGIFFDPENEGDIFHSSISCFSMAYTTPLSRQRNENLLSDEKDLDTTAIS